MQENGGLEKKKSTKEGDSTGKSGSPNGKPKFGENSSTNIQTSNSPAFSQISRKFQEISQPKPFNLKHVINSVNSPQMTRKLSVSGHAEGLLSSNLESESLINAHQSPIRLRESSSGELRETKRLSGKGNVQSARISRFEYQPTSVLKSLQVDQSFTSQKSGLEIIKNSKFAQSNELNSINQKVNKQSGQFRFISQSVTSSKMQLNPRATSDNWRQLNEMSIDKSYSIINLNEAPAQDIQSSLKREMAGLARAFGFQMIDFRVNYLLFVFVKNLNACFYLSSKAKNYCRI